MIPAHSADRTTDSSALSSSLTCAAGALAGVLVALAILLTLPLWHAFEYRPYGGVVGPPAYWNRPSASESLAYLVGVPLAAILGWAGARLATRPPAGLYLAVVACAAEFAFILAARKFDWIPRSRATALLGSIQHDPMALAQVALLGFLACLLALPPPRIDSPTPTLRGPLLRVTPPGDALLRYLSCHSPIFIMLMIVFGAAMPSLLLGFVCAIPFTALLGASLGCPEFPRKASHVTVWLELLAWCAIALMPAGLWWLRLRLTFNQPVPTSLEVMAIVMGIGMLPVLFGWLRRRRQCAPAFDPVWLLPPALLGLFLLAAGVGNNYDPFHQGEFTYPVQAMRRGLEAWTEVFIVHGLGANTLPGLFMGPPTPLTHSLDLTAVNILLGVTSALELIFLLRLWRRPWWLFAFFVVFFTGVAGGPPCFRYLPLWIVLLLTLEFLLSRRLKWLALAGCVAWLSLFYSLDVGALLLVACGVWSVLWGLVFGRSTIQQRRSQTALMGRTYPAIAYSFGVAAAAIPTLLLMWGGGILTDFWNLHLEYLRVKHHYDKTPFELDFLLSVVSPVASVLGIWTAVGIVRRRESGPLPGAILLLLILNLLAFVRAFDRSDSGHIAYASLLAWPLLGCLLVWQARGRTQNWPERRETPAAIPPIAPLYVLGRSLLAGALLMLIPYTRPLINNPPALSVPGQPVWSLVLPITYVHQLFPANARKPFTRPVDDPLAVGFFRVVGEIGELLGAPGAWSRETVRPLYDFSNEPALYTWTGLTAPTRFFAAYYTAGEKWQNEVVREVNTQRTPWVLWRGPMAWANGPDAMPNYLRQWRVAEYVLAHYEPARQIAAGSGLPDALLLRLRDTTTTPSLQAAPFASQWAGPVDLNELPYVFGKNKTGVPATPARKLTHADLSGDKPEDFWRVIADPPSLAPARELQVTITPPVEGPIQFIWQTSASDPPHSLSFNAHADFAGPYRIRLANLPSWVWGGPPRRIQFIVPPSETPIEIHAEWLGN